MPDEQLAFDFGADQPVDPGSSSLSLARTLGRRLGRLAERGVYVGTSSWKYPGWLGQIYDPQRYAVRGRLARKRFADECLADYAAVLPTVCGDFAFYQFPSEATWHNTFAQLPPGFRFSLKVPEDVTIEHFPKLLRYGQRAGTDNPHFMDASVVRDLLLDRLEPYRDRLGVLIFEFGTIYRRPMCETRHFATELGHMLSRLPTDRFRFAVEVRNPAFLGDDGSYLACLHAHGVAHCLNSWTHMPPVDEQMRVPGILTARHVAGRFLLRPGRSYQEAVEQFQPYERIQDPYPEGRDALRQLIDACVADSRTLFAFVNNRFEGNALETIDLATAAHETG